MLGVSLATAERYWTFAKTWLFAELSDRNLPLCVRERGGGVRGMAARIGEGMIVISEGFRGGSSH